MARAAVHRRAGRPARGRRPLQRNGRLRARRSPACSVTRWAEIIPGREETTGLAFHHDAPGARAPQACCWPSRRAPPIRTGASTRSGTPWSRPGNWPGSAASGRTGWSGSAPSSRRSCCPTPSSPDIPGRQPARSSPPAPRPLDRTEPCPASPSPESPSPSPSGAGAGGQHLVAAGGSAAVSRPGAGVARRRSPTRCGCCAGSGSSWSSPGRTPGRPSTCGSRASRRRCRAICPALWGRTLRRRARD